MAIEGRGDKALGKIKYGMVGGGEGACAKAGRGTSRAAAKTRSLMMPPEKG